VKIPVLPRSALGLILIIDISDINLPACADRRRTELATPFGAGIRRIENLRCLLIEKQVLTAEVRAGHMPVEVLVLT
jgi:hypothetical protein